MKKSLLHQVFKAAALFLLTGLQPVLAQTQMAIWTFPTVSNASSTTFNATTETVAGTPGIQQFFQSIDNNGVSGTSYTDLSSVSHAAGSAIAWDDITGSGTDAELVIAIDATGWNTIFFRFDYKSESATSFDVMYSTDGGVSFTQIINNTSLNADGFSSWSSKTVDLSSYTMIENQSGLQIKIQDLDNQGNDRFAFDNIEFYGNNGGGGPVSNTPSVQLDASSTQFLLLGAASGTASGVISDLTDPLRTKGATFLLRDGDTPLNTLTLTAASSNSSVVSNSNLVFTTINDSIRSLKITPTGVGYANITITVSDGSGSDTYLIYYAASAAAYDIPNTDFHTGISDASTAIDAGNNYILSGDDESNGLHLYHKDSSGYFSYAYDIAGPMGISGEGDFEASCRKGNRIYWLSSMGNSSSGNIKPERHRFFATAVSGSGASTTVNFMGSYSLRAAMINWGDAHGYDFSASADDGMIPKRIDGFNAEGLCLGPNDTSLYIGFRAPLVPIGNRTKALICPVLNFEAWFNNGSPLGSPAFGNPIELNLGGRGIRSIEKNANGQYLIVAGSYDNVHNAALYEWNGVPSSAPVLLTADLTGLNPEGIVSFPSPFYNGSVIELMSDDGTQVWYNDGIENKLLADRRNKKFRTVKVATAGGTLQPCSGASLTGVTAAQPLICSGNSTTLTINGTLNGAANWNVYTGSCGGTSVATTSGTTVLVTPSATETYYIRGEGGCSVPGSCSMVTVTVSSCVGISQAALDNSFKIFPNPAADVLNIQASGIHMYQVEIYNPVGQLVFSGRSLNAMASLSLTELASGIYQVRIVAEQGIVTKRIVKN